MPPALTPALALDYVHELSADVRAAVVLDAAGALLAGGVVAAPIAAWLVKHLAARVLGTAAGGLIILTNSKTLLEAVGVPGVGVAATAAVVFVLWVSGIVWAVKQERLAKAAAADEPALESAPA